jgi:hypothetical protein
MHLLTCTSAFFSLIKIRWKYFSVLIKFVNAFFKIKGDVTLPSREEMWKDVRSKLDAMRKQYVESPRHTIQVHYIDHMDDLAALNGNYPYLGTCIFHELADPDISKMGARSREGDPLLKNCLTFRPQCHKTDYSQENSQLKYLSLGLGEMRIF